MAGRPKKDGVKAPIEKEVKVVPKETKEDVKSLPQETKKVEPKKVEEVKPSKKKDIPRKECGNNSCPYGYGSSYCKSCIDYIRS